MSYRTIVYALGAAWLVLMSSVARAVARRRDGGRRLHPRHQPDRVVSHVAGRRVGRRGDRRGTHARGGERGVGGIKLAGYLPLAASVFIVGALVVMIAFRVLVQPAFA